VTGIASFIAGPAMGKIADTVGKYRTFVVGSVLSIVVIIYYTQLGITPLWAVIIVNVVLFTAITARAIPAQALASAVPAPADRGAFMSISASLQQLAGGVASSLAGLLVTQKESGEMEHYPRLGYVVAAAVFATIVLMGKINAMVMRDVRDGAGAPGLK